MNNYTKLDNPAWNSLNETHRLLSIGNPEVKFYRPDVCPFGGLYSSENDLASFIRNHNELISFFIIGDKPAKTDGLIIEKELVCLQMVCNEPVNVKISENITALNEEHKEQLIRLINFVQPGYFKEGTVKMGDYFGIFRNNKLVAVTGERMKMYGFTEVSAVVTHPDYTGKGFAKQLVGYTANKNFERAIVPYLHVAETNQPAIALYEKLGFVTRRKISLWMMKRTT